VLDCSICGRRSSPAHPTTSGRLSLRPGAVGDSHNRWHARWNRSASANQIVGFFSRLKTVPGQLAGGTGCSVANYLPELSGVCRGPIEFRCGGGVFAKVHQLASNPCSRAPVVLATANRNMPASRALGPLGWRAQDAVATSGVHGKCKPCPQKQTKQKPPTSA
jgi:hypothetical protein